jgi:thiamine-phosphate pyrophosphorylase
MRQGYSGPMRTCQTLPSLWLLSDERNDAGLEAALRILPRRSGFIFRHYHLTPRERFARYCALRRIARARGHVVILADSALTAKEWRADGYYGSPRSLTPRRPGLLALATVHDLDEIALANQVSADAALLSPVFPTRSHPGAAVLGPLRFRLLARQAAMPVIALGGMDERTARRLDWPRWAAIDGLSTGPTGGIS